MDKQELFLKNIWPKIVKFLDQYSQANYKGWYGPYIWSEDGDLKRLITRFCEDDFGVLQVHNETRIAKYTFSQFELDRSNGLWGNKKGFAIDIDITDAATWKGPEDFRNSTHELFIEVKGLMNKYTYGEPKTKKIPGFEKDCEKLKKLIDNGYCQYGIAILIDQGDQSGNHYVTDKDKKMQELRKDFSPVIPLIWQKIT
ncbi:hypothetical protein LCGC14_1408180 [marine sediment metagenome]|uniref:Uncharacterized protein n=1 Tax=marine sediment metagenome TaxID=412755 RepID=A0A0F9JVB9_9ZZZZ